MDLGIVIVSLFIIFMILVGDAEHLVLSSLRLSLRKNCKFESKCSFENYKTLYIEI